MSFHLLSLSDDGGALSIREIRVFFRVVTYPYVLMRSVCSNGFVLCMDEGGEEKMDNQSANVLAIVTNESHPTKTTSGKGVQELIIMDEQCHFEVSVKDNSGIATATVSNEVAKNMLFLSAEEIYEITFVKEGVFSIHTSFISRMLLKEEEGSISILQEEIREAYDRVIAFANSLETFGGGLNDPISVAYGSFPFLFVPF
ncbi:hypothetical protein FXO38_16140 [Capsicum annuum]|nr:hypothetical protein FXO38_16140 [Capsicum annuum]KAF3680493.1 hypothetical protein FXO37_03298 [Capsicum annuum]